MQGFNNNISYSDLFNSCLFLCIPNKSLSGFTWDAFAQAKPKYFLQENLHACICACTHTHTHKVTSWYLCRTSLGPENMMLKCHCLYFFPFKIASGKVPFELGAKKWFFVLFVCFKSFPRKVVVPKKITPMLLITGRCHQNHQLSIWCLCCLGAKDCKIHAHPQEEIFLHYGALCDIRENRAPHTIDS